MPGVIRTRVGYAGGTKKNPTYTDLGDHTETIQIDFDPSRVTYRRLLEIFWKEHTPTAKPWSRQYMAAVFTHSDAQRRAVEETRDAIAAESAKPVRTQILGFTGFTRAEDYHQKYRLRNSAALMKRFQALYPNDRDFVDSTAAARANGVLSGYGSKEQFEAEALKLPPALREALAERF